MASINYPYPDPKNDAEREAKRQAEDDYERQEQEAADFLDWAEGLPTVAPELLLEQVRLDLATAGLHMAPPEPLADEEQGGVVVYLDDDRVVVDWLPQIRLDPAALGQAEADRADSAAGICCATVREAMDTALGTILTGFRYTTTRRPHSRLGHIIGQPPTTPDF
ncbi:hypothetical protein ACIPWI_38500 [Streptomyces sp. NPDC090046]|uniref:hypothetical protein n=1 Tax=Streptomyces sp. NPDC090046 TaxID=3365928 RepID=UPI0038270BE2